MGKKVKEYKSGDFIFAKVKGYPAWPARVQKPNGKKYFVYFYGTGETANLPPNMIFDYAENKDKFLTKTVKRRDFNDGVKQIEHDFANNVPLEQVIGAAAGPPADSANDSANDTANDTMDDSAIDTTAADDTVDESAANTTQNDTMVEDSDDAGTLVIDEGKKGKKPNATKTPAKEQKGKEPKTPRGKAKKEDGNDEEDKKEEEIVSRSGRKIRPKRYIDEQTEENTTLPSPMPKKRRGASPTTEKEKDGDKEKEKQEPVKEKPAGKLYNSITQSELEDLKEPFKQDDADKDNILITYLPSGQYVGVKLFQSRPTSFKNDATKLAWDKQSATNSILIKQQLERGHIIPQSVAAQLVMDLNLTDEEKAALDKERETEEKKSRVQFLKTEMKLIELDAKIKTCLCLEKADTELCLKLLHQLSELEMKPLMLLKHPSCVETVKRMRAYVGNTPSWDLSEQAAAQFSKQAHRIRKQADAMYTKIRNLFTTPEGVSFWEFFSDRVLQFKKATAALSADELLELVHEPLELSTPSAYTMKAAIDAANEQEKAEEETNAKKKAATPAKTKKPANNTPSKPALKRQSSRKQQQEEKEAQKNDAEDSKQEEAAETKENDTEKAKNEEESSKDNAEENNDKEKEKSDAEKEENEKESTEKENGKDLEIGNDSKENEKDSDKSDKPSDSEEKKEKTSDKKEKGSDRKDKNDKSKEDKEESKGDSEKEKEDVAEPRAKRSRESKKTEPPPPRSPAKRKSKA